MTGADALKLTASSDREITMMRSFDAPRDLAFEAVSGRKR